MLPKRISRPLVAAALVFAILSGASACAMSFDARTLGVEASMATAGTAQPAGEAFQVNAKAVFLLWGTVPASHPRLDRVLAGQLGTGKEIQNLAIKVRSRWSDILIMALTGGLIVPRSVTFEGVVVTQGQ